MKTTILHWWVPLRQIVKVSVCTNARRALRDLSALSLDRLRVSYESAEIGTASVTISPKPKQMFLDDLAQTAGLELETDGLVRPGWTGKGLENRH